MTVDKPDITKYIDPSLSLISVTLIFISLRPLLVRSSEILLQTVPEGIDIDSLERLFLVETPEVRAIHDLHIWQLSSSSYIATAHVIVDAEVMGNHTKYMRVLEEMKDFFHHKRIHSTTIQVEMLPTPIPNAELNKSTAERVRSELQTCLAACDDPSAAPEITSLINKNNNKNLKILTPSPPQPPVKRQEESKSNKSPVIGSINKAPPIKRTPAPRPSDLV